MAGGEHHLREEAISIRDLSIVCWIINEQLERMVELLAPTLVHDEDAVRIDDRGKSVSNQNDSATLKARPQLLLNQIVRLQVNVGRRLVEHQDPRLLKDGTGQADQLLLAD